MTERNDQRRRLVEELKGVASRLGTDYVSRAAFLREGRVSGHQIYANFDSWTELTELAGLTSRAKHRLSDDELFGAMIEAFADCDEIPTKMRFNKLCEFSDTVYSRRWGSWQNILSVFRE